jgi:predicted ATP-grasp superfamily ATP-dependent carboligase
MDVLIFGNHTQGLGIIRSLRDTGYRVQMLNDKHVALGRFSRYITKYHKLPKQSLSYLHEAGKSAFLIDYLNEFSSSSKKCAIFCVDEDLVNFIYGNRQILSKRFIIPENNIKLITDKYLFSQAVDSLGFRVPVTSKLSDFSEMPQNGEMKYIYKGRCGSKLKNLMSSKGAEIATNEALNHLRKSIYGKVEEHEVLIQEKIKRNQEVLSCCGLSINGELRRIFQYVKLRQHPDEFGTGTFLKSIHDDNITNISVRILEHFSYTGIFEIELIKDEDGEYIVLEMNPRTWKSINFATDCGQNMCSAFCDYLLKGVMPVKNLQYDVGRYWVDLGTDIPMLFKYRQFGGYRRCSSFCVLDVKDPLPFIMEIILAPLIMLNI